MAGDARSVGAATLLAAAPGGRAASSPAIDETVRRRGLRGHTATDRTGASDDAKCQACGFQPGTGGYADCRARLRQQRAPPR
jgi:hypothetical protein